MRFDHGRKRFGATTILQRTSAISYTVHMQAGPVKQASKKTQDIYLHTPSSSQPDMAARRSEGLLLEISRKLGANGD